MDPNEGSFLAAELKMRLWDVLALCFLLLSAVSTSPIFQSLRSDKRLRPLAQAFSVPSLFLEDHESQTGSKDRPESTKVGELLFTMQRGRASPEPGQLADMLDFIRVTVRRLRRSSESRHGGTRGQKQRANGGQARKGARGRKRARGGSKGGKNGGCVLKQLHLNVTDLGLGYQTKEELIFKYCSGPCANSETNYDRILNNLTHNKRLEQDSPPRACCRPVAFDDDLSFLDDNLIYHTLRRHSAKKCACV